MLHTIQRKYFTWRKTCSLFEVSSNSNMSLWFYFS
jgi:hypothetical protein